MSDNTVQLAVQKALQLHEKANDLLFRGDATGGAEGRRMLRACRRLRREGKQVLADAGPDARAAYLATEPAEPDNQARRKWHEQNNFPTPREHGDD